MGLKTKNILLAVLMAGALLAGFLCCLLLPDREFSQSERRKLATMPELSAENLLSGAFAEDFETYVQDQFPLREGFRGLSDPRKALAAEATGKGPCSGPGLCAFHRDAQLYHFQRR